MVIFEPRKDKFLLLLFAPYFLPYNTETVIGQFYQFWDTIYDDCSFFDDTEHVWYKHEMFFSDVESSEEGEVYLEDAFVVLENGLKG